MKTTKIFANGCLSMFIGLLLALCATQAAAVTYNAQSTKYNAQTTMYNAQQAAPYTVATAPTSGFQSTSPYPAQWGQDDKLRMINADGSVNEAAYGIGMKAMAGPRRDPAAPNPDVDDENDEGNVPLGDILWPLMLMAMMYAAVRVLRRKPEIR